MQVENIRYAAAETPPLTELQNALVRAGVRPLYDADVHAYQERVRERALRRAALPVISACLGLGFLAAVFLAMAWRMRDMASVFPAGGCLGLACATRSLWSGISQTICWHSREGVYPPGATPPQEILRRASHIQNQLPRVAFAVEYLDADPFLIASHEGERYYVAVWNEKGFVL